MNKEQGNRLSDEPKETAVTANQETGTRTNTTYQKPMLRRLGVLASVAGSSIGAHGDAGAWIPLP